MRSASRRDAIRRVEQQKAQRLEEKAIQSLACEMSIHSRVSNVKVYHLSPALRKHLALQCVPTVNNMTERFEEVKRLTDLATRASPLDSDHLTFAPSIDASNTDADDGEKEIVLPIVYARSSYRGKHVHGDELDLMSPIQRFSNLIPIGDSWVLPSSGEYGNYVIDFKTYGEKKGLDSELNSVKKAFDDARRCTDEIISMLFSVKAFGDHPDVDNTATTSCNANVKSVDDAYSTVRMVLDDANPFCRNGQDTLIELRAKILKRHTLLNTGLKINNRIQRTILQVRSENKGRRSFPCLRDVVSCAGMPLLLCSCMTPHAICSLLQTCKWDAETVSELNAMLPGLAVYTLMGGHFPHIHSAMNSIAVVHKETMVKIAVGFRRVKYIFDSNDEDASTAEVHTFDAAYTVAGSKNNQTVTTFDTSCRADVQEIPISYIEYFENPPELYVSLVDAETEELFHDNCPMGGLLADRSMRNYIGRNTYARLWFNTNFERWTKNRTNVKLGILFKFSLKKCSNTQRPLKIRVVMTGTDRRKRPFQLTTYSEPFLLRSSRMNASNVDARKRQKR